MLKVLIAEDDVMIADLIEDAVLSGGYVVCGIASTVAEAVALARFQRPDLAVIDMRLAGGGLGTEIVHQLLDVPRIGFLFASGNVEQVIELADRDACIAKPFHPADLVKALALVTEIVNDGTASPPFPRGFQRLTARGSPHPEPTHA
jgi:two-component system, response regulator PdtaR